MTAKSGGMQRVCIYEALRSPRGAGKPGGALSGVSPTDLLAGVLRALDERTMLDWAHVGEAIIGCVTQTGEQAGNVGKSAAIAAGLPDSLSVATVNHFCASSLWAFNVAAARIAAGEDALLAGGVESMSRVPMGSDQPPFLVDPATIRRLRSVPMGVSADAIATQHGLEREEIEQYAVTSQQRAAQARAEGRFARSLVPVRDASGTTLLEHDETIRAGTTVAKLLSMQPFFAEMGEKWADAIVRSQYPQLAQIAHVHHAGNSPAMADGASIVLLAAEGSPAVHGKQPRARVLATAIQSDEHVIALNGAIAATRNAIARAGLQLADIDLFEVNEAFGGPTLVYARSLGIDLERLNVNGGAIALGHAMGSTGTALVGTLLEELERRQLRYGVVAVCGALGLGAAAVIERID